MKEHILLSDLDVVELNSSELINGGSWLSYAIGYAVGTIVNISEAYGNGMSGLGTGPR